MVVGNIYLIRLNGFVAPSNVANVFHYRVASGNAPGTTVADIASAWWNVVRTNYRNFTVQSYTTAFLTVDVEDVLSKTGLYGTWPIPVADQAGNRPVVPSTGEGFVAAFVAAGIRLNVENRLTRPGQKRVWGLSENDLNGNSLIPGALGNLQNLAASFVSNVTVNASGGGTLVLEPVVRGTPKPGTTVSPVNRVVSASVQSSVRTQVSRRVRPTS